MRDSTVEFKIKVFISSKCGGRYTIVRKAIKTLLLETGLFEVYMFEDSGASSQDVAPSYMHELEDSHICLFLIDNDDNVSNATLREIKRARELKRKSIYLFCDEKIKEHTQVQKEIYELEREKAHTVHEFSEFTELGYRSIVREIVNIYRHYGNGLLVFKQGDSSISDPDGGLYRE